MPTISLLIRRLLCEFLGPTTSRNAQMILPADTSFAALAKREGVSPPYLTRIVRLSYLAPNITQAILDGHQPRDLMTDKLQAHSRLPGRGLSRRPDPQ